VGWRGGGACGVRRVHGGCEGSVARASPRTRPRQSCLAVRHASHRPSSPPSSAAPARAAGSPARPIARIHTSPRRAGAMVRVITPPSPCSRARRRAQLAPRRHAARPRARPAPGLARPPRRAHRGGRGRLGGLVVEADVAGRGSAGGPRVRPHGGGAVHRGAGSPPPRHRGARRRRAATRARFAPDPALSRAFGGGAGRWVSLSRPDTMVTLAVPCPAPRRGGAARRVAVPGAGGVDARLVIGPGAHLNGMGAAVAYPVHPATREEGGDRRGGPRLGRLRGRRHTHADGRQPGVPVAPSHCPAPVSLPISVPAP
jgi:hypothetical protein